MSVIGNCFETIVCDLHTHTQTNIGTYRLNRPKGWFSANWAFGSLQTSLLCIVGELARGESVALAACGSDRWQVICKMWHVTYDTWYLIIDMGIRKKILKFFWIIGIGATIRTRWEIQFLPYEGFLIDLIWKYLFFYLQK